MLSRKTSDGPWNVLRYEQDEANTGSGYDDFEEDEELDDEVDEDGDDDEDEEDDLDDEDDEVDEPRHGRRQPDWD